MKLIDIAESLKPLKLMIHLSQFGHFSSTLLSCETITDKDNAWLFGHFHSEYFEVRNNVCTVHVWICADDKHDPIINNEGKVYTTLEFETEFWNSMQ